MGATPWGTNNPYSALSARHSSQSEQCDGEGSCIFRPTVVPKLRRPRTQVSLEPLLSEVDSDTEMLEAGLEELDLDHQRSESSDTNKFDRALYLPRSDIQPNGDELPGYSTEDDEVDRFLREMQVEHIRSCHERSPTPGAPTERGIAKSEIWGYTKFDAEFEDILDRLLTKHITHRQGSVAGLVDDEEIELEHVEDINAKQEPNTLAIKEEELEDDEDSDFFYPYPTHIPRKDKGRKVTTSHASEICPPSPSFGYDICERYYDSFQYNQAYDVDQPLQSTEVDLYKQRMSTSSTDSGHMLSSDNDGGIQQGRHTINDRRKLRSSTPSPPPRYRRLSLPYRCVQRAEGYHEDRKRSRDEESDEMLKEEESPGKKARAAMKRL